MDSFDSHDTAGRLLISTDVVEKIARLAALEVDGVFDVAPVKTASQSLLGKIAPQRPIRVELKNDVADIEVALTVEYGVKIPELSENVQKNVKESVQNMTSITVASVNVVVGGIAGQPKEEAE